MTVYNELGHGFLESVYQDALQVELSSRHIPFSREHPIQIQYKGAPLPAVYRCDFLCFDELIVELKGIQTLTSVEEAHVIHYLKATGLRKALLLNFRGLSFEQKRLIHGPPEFFGAPLRKPALPQDL